ncbi:FAD-dependent monooxygenase [Asanoa sp. NPDC049518]|uniref:FAD-dependent monooxygenase n=1 Tax=unclassified Asanoa TaxID=2685164 RepID=UPI0034241CE9
MNTTPHSPADAGHHRPSPLRIAVVGGSLTGPVTAMLLHAAGFPDVTVYEAAPAHVPLAGGLISLEHPALEVLDRLGIDQSEVLACPSEHIVQMDIRDRIPTRTLTRTYPGRNTTWTLLHAALAQRMPAGTVRTGHRLTDLHTSGGRPRLRFTNGDTATADLVVFADGRASTGRRILDPDRALRYAGYVAHRGTTQPPTLTLSDFLRMQPWPGAQFNIAPIPGALDWTFYLNATAGQYEAWFGAPPTRRLMATGRHVSGPARTVVDACATALLPTDHAEVVRTTTQRMAVPVIDIDPPQQMVWPVGDGWAVLIGDALAPVRAHIAKGANNGIEQAAGLAAALHQHHKFGADLGAALGGWQRRYLPAVHDAITRGAAIGARLGLGTTALAVAR